ncbi:MAG: hypothetical protein JF616_13485 [Fibrobacteres bacterium]|nr:hypothetical protein [Fibrobacterota bacterium]
MSKLRLLCLALAAWAAAPAPAQVFPEALPANRGATTQYSPRMLALGEPRFTDSSLYNLYDQGGSPMGLLETRKEHVGLSLGYLGSQRATPGDSLTLSHSDFSIPQLGFFQPGVFGASLYFLRESEAYRQRRGDSVENGANLFGLDMAAGPASGLFRVGFSAHARLGSIDYPGDPNRILLSVPSLRFDLGSRVLPGLETGIFAGFGASFDSLRTPTGDLERVASMTLPRYGILADVGGTEALPVMGNVVLELGTDRTFGEYRPAGGDGIQYPTVWTDYWTFQTQWMYPLLVQDFRLQPAIRFAHRSEKAQGYKGLKGNQDPFKKGSKIDSLKLTRSVNDFGLGAQISFREIVSVLMEWETAGHTYEADSSHDERYNRFSVGLEHYVHRLPIDFPKSVSLVLRAGWTWRQDPKDQPGYRDFHFEPFLPSGLIGGRKPSFSSKPDAPAAYSALSLGFSLGVLEDKLLLDGFLGFPEQRERMAIGTQDATGTEIGATLTYRVL